MKKYLSHGAFIMCLLALPVSAPVRDLGEVTNYFLNVEVGPEDTAQNIVCIYCSIHASGAVSGDLVAIGGDIEILGKVEGDVVAVGGGVKLGPGAQVSGDAVSLGGTLGLGAQAKVGGTSKSAAWFYLPGQRSVHARGALAFVGLCLAVALVLALILRVPRLENTAGAARNRPVWTVASGLVVFAVGVLILSVAENFGRAEDFVTRTTTGLGFVLFSSGLAGLSFGLGGKLLPGKPVLVRVLAGSLALSLGQLVPLLGLAGFLAILVVALGATIVSGFGGGAEWLPARLRRRVTGIESSKSAVP